MLLAPHRKKLATIIVAGLESRKPSYVQRMGEESGTGKYVLPEEGVVDEGLESAALALLRAIDDRSVQGMVKALKAFASMCDEDDHMEF
jgi:hypothetical protein